MNVSDIHANTTTVSPTSATPIGLINGSTVVSTSLPSTRVFVNGSTVPSSSGLLTTAGANVSSTNSDATVVLTIITTTTPRVTTALPITSYPSTVRVTNATTAAPPGQLLLGYGHPSNDAEVFFNDKNDGYNMVYLPETFFFGSNRYRTAYINVNGYVTFDRAYVSVNPKKLSEISNVAIVAPFWADIDLNDFRNGNIIGQNEGKVFYKCISRRTYFSAVSSSDDRQVYESVRGSVLNSIDKTGNFNPTSVCKFTWSNVSPYPFSPDTQSEQATFQLVLTTDARSRRSYMIFSYEKITWNALRANSQGYRMSDYNVFYSPSQYVYTFYTSGTASAINLPKLQGPKGSPGVWFFQGSFSQFEVFNSAEYQCYVWYEQQLGLNPLTYHSNMPDCPCTLWQAMMDPRFTPYYSEYFWNPICYTTTFPAYGTATRKCCYDNYFWRWSWWWSWWTPWFSWSSFSWLWTFNGYYSSNMLLYHPNYYPGLHRLNDILPKRWCCLESNNCDLYYEVRPQSYCWNYRMPFWGFMFGDPHITTLDGVSYIFNGLGEFWMIYSKVFHMQARTARYKSGSDLINATIFTGFAFHDFTETSVAHVPTLSVFLADDGMGLVLKRDSSDSDDLTSWFQKAPDNNSTTNDDLKSISLVKNYTDLIISFPSGIKVKVSVVEKALLASLTVPDDMKSKAFNGLYGQFDGNPTNDFKFPNGSVISINSTERQLFEFGQSWAVKSISDSWFWYNSSRNESFSTYQQTNFVPLFSDESSFQSPVSRTEAEAFCTKDGKVDPSCVFDYRVTGSKSFANGTHETVQTKTSLLQAVQENKVGQLVINTAPYYFSANTTTTIRVNVTGLSSSSTMSMDPLNQTMFPGASIACNDSSKQPCQYWTFTWTPQSKDLKPFNLTFSGNSNDTTIKPVTVNALACNCNGLGDCMWENIINTANSSNSSSSSSSSNVTDLNVYQEVACNCKNLVATGPKCENTIDYCFTNPCGYNRTCASHNSSKLLQLLNQIKESSTNEPFIGYACSDCPHGYSKDSLERCVDIDECKNASANNCTSPEEKCVNTAGSFRCDCNSGYIRNDNLTKCVDKDECRTVLDNNCDQICNNTIGSFFCSCFPGYNRDNTTQSCTKTGNCTVKDGCHYCLDGENCACRMGYKVQNGVCIDIDECNQTSPCDSTSSNCINMNGTYECVCKDGYQKDNSTGICLACQDGMYGKNCSKLCQCPSASCNKATGCQSSCENRGFTGADCDENVNECQINGICGAAICNDTHGSYHCYCPQWFQLIESNTNINCSVIDACQYNVTDGGIQLVNGTCMNNGVCKNGTNSAALGKFVCECAPGFDGKFCEHDIDECLNNNCDLKTQHCVDQINGFYCACNPGVSGPGCNFFAQSSADNVTTAAPSAVTTTFPSSTSNGTNANITQPTTTISVVTTAATNDTQAEAAKVAAIVFPVVFTTMTVASVAIIFGPNFLQWIVALRVPV